MPFYESIREYREQLEITQMEAADQLGIDHSVLSKYELGRLAIPIDLLPTFRKVYAIPKDRFIDMIEDTRNKSSNPGLEARENRGRYAMGFQDEYITDLINIKEVRQFFVYLHSLDTKAVKTIISEVMKKR